MPTRTWYINQIGGNLFYDRSSEAASTANATSLSGWTVGKTAAGRYSDLANGTERIATTFTTTIVPTATAPAVNIVQTTTPPYTPPNLLVSNECIGLLYEYNARFPAGNWVFTFPVIAVSNANGQDGRMGLRVFKATRSGDTFTGVTELTTVRLVGTTITNLTTTTPLNSIVTWAAPSFSLNNEFLLAKIGWEITGAAGNNASDVLIRYGLGSTLVSPNFKKQSYNTVSF